MAAVEFKTTETGSYWQLLAATHLRIHLNEADVTAYLPWCPAGGTAA